MDHNQKGFSLPEMLISVAISAIIMGAAFGSYSIIQNNFKFKKITENKDLPSYINDNPKKFSEFLI